MYQDQGMEIDTDLRYAVLYLAADGLYHRVSDISFLLVENALDFTTKGLYKGRFFGVGLYKPIICSENAVETEIERRNNDNKK